MTVEELEPGLLTIINAVKARHNTEEFKNSLFILRPYCWCDGNKPGHEDACPPNFQHANGLCITWYKRVGRGMTCNRDLNMLEWTQIIIDCLTSI